MVIIYTSLIAIYCGIFQFPMSNNYRYRRPKHSLVCFGITFSMGRDRGTLFKSGACHESVKGLSCTVHGPKIRNAWHRIQNASRLYLRGQSVLTDSNPEATVAIATHSSFSTTLCCPRRKREQQIIRFVSSVEDSGNSWRKFPLNLCLQPRSS